jgi:hypothetical protein
MNSLSENENEQYLKQSVWKQTTKGDWRLFFDTNQEKQTTTDSETLTKSINEINIRKALKMGSLVMTPKGIGRLIKLEDKIATIKFMKNEDEEDTFEESLISSDFPINLRVFDKEFSNWYRLIVPANGTIELLKKMIEDLKIVDNTTSNYFLVYDGSETKDEYFFDQMDMKNNAKILLCGMKMTPCKISRFTTSYNWWYTYNCDGISFSTNKKIKLSGVGLYGSHESKTQNGTLKIFEGTVSSMGSVLYEEPAEVPPTPDQTNCIAPVMFKKPVTIKPHLDYTIQLLCTNYCYLYYGGGGRANVPGEKNVEFNFKYTPGSSHGTSAETGNFGEFYYFA